MRSFLFILFVLLLTYSGFSQFQNVMITDVRSPNEPSIVINPKNPDQLVVGVNLRSYHYSTDGGYTWTGDTMHSTAYGVWGDPCIIVDTAGDFYFFHLSNPDSGYWIDRIVCQKYDIDENQWNDGSAMGFNGTKKQDKEWAVVDSATNTIYVTWTQFDQYNTSAPDKFSNIMFSKSTDQGETWTDALQINEISGDCLDDDNTTEGAVPSVGPEGQVYVAWSGPEGIVFDRSLDGGETWLEDDIFIDSQPGGWNYDISGIPRCNGLPVTCCDISQSEQRGTIYVNWTDQRNGEDDTDVWISKSTDGGDTWSDPKRVNDDPAGSQQFFSWMTIDQANGDIYVVFYDRRNYDDRNTDVYLARSSDGGLTFENMKISESPFVPQTGHTGDPFFGDYTNITAYNQIVRPIWARQDVQQMSIWTAIMDLATYYPEPKEFIPFSLEQNYPNPFAYSTHFSFKLHEPSYITLSVTDMYGRHVTTLIDRRRMQVGKYVESFDAHYYKMSPGIYYFMLTDGKHRQERKMILIE